MQVQWSLFRRSIWTGFGGNNVINTKPGKFFFVSLFFPVLQLGRMAILICCVYCKFSVQLGLSCHYNLLVNICFIVLIQRLRKINHRAQDFYPLCSFRFIVLWRVVYWVLFMAWFINIAFRVNFFRVFRFIWLGMNLNIVNSTCFAIIFLSSVNWRLI